MARTEKTFAMAACSSPRLPGGSGRGGRPRDPQIGAAIFSATLEGLADLGYDRLSIEEIAARAGVGKSAIYRRWRSKAELTVAACTSSRDELGALSLPDTGSLRGDIDAFLAAFPHLDVLAGRHLAVMAGLVGPALRDPELRAAINATYLDLPRQVAQVLLDRAVRRGEVPAGRDLGLFRDAVLAFNTFRLLVLGEAPDREFLRRVLLEVVYPAVTAPVGADRRPDEQRGLRA